MKQIIEMELDKDNIENDNCYYYFSCDSNDNCFKIERCYNFKCSYISFFIWTMDFINNNFVLVYNDDNQAF